MAKFLGIVMTPLDVQVEGMNAVMDRIESTGATAINCSSTVNRQSDPHTGFRAPPLDIDGYYRVFDRPVWGKHELYLESFRAKKPDLSWYDNLHYKPEWKEIPNDLDADLPDKIHESAKKRGWKIYASVTPLAIPKLRDEDKMRWINGQIPDPNRRVANQGCPSSPNVRAWAIATVLDEISQQPQVDGICLDWVEYTTYLLEDHFSCFNPHSRQHMQELGYDSKRIEQDVINLWNYLHNLTSDRLDHTKRIVQNPSEIIDLLVRFSGYCDFLRFKSDVVHGLYHEIRKAMDQSGYADIELVANGWAPPFNRSSGMDYGRLAETVQCVRPKLYTFHWSSMPRWYGQVLKSWNPDLGESAILEAIKTWFNLPDNIKSPTFENYHIPRATENHPVHFETFAHRVDEVVRQVGERVPVTPLAHGYVPLEQWKQTVTVVRDTAADGMWVQRYCYLSDEKISALAEIWNIGNEGRPMALGSFF
ncbi:MAG: hypothetical protein VX677_11245 [Candidatus Poribacteria bacterium]|nr:hypothetical protein [Candidatus Poribacteria bacterium]